MTTGFSVSLYIMAVFVKIDLKGGVIHMHEALELTGSQLPELNLVFVA